MKGIAMRLLPALMLLAAPLAAQSQSSPDSIMAPIKRLFDGMRAHDSTLLRSAIIDGAVMMSGVPSADGPQQVTFRPAEGFVTGASRPGEPWDEHIFEPVIQVDGGLATVWMRYNFHLGERLLHCGYNAFHLVHTTQGWKISMIADTRRTEGCG